MQYHTRQKDSILALLQEQEEQFLTVDEIRRTAFRSASPPFTAP